MESSLKEPKTPDAASAQANAQTIGQAPALRILRAVTENTTAAQAKDHSLEVGRVRCVVQDGFLVEREGSEILAKRAAGCLLRPEPGDKVMFFQERKGLSYILHILEKESATCDMDFPDTLRISAPDLRLEGVRGRASFLKLELTARDCELRAASLRTVASSIVQRAASCLRLLGEERLRVRRQQIRVKGRWSLDAQEATLTAQKDVHVDGEHIHLG